MTKSKRLVKGEEQIMYNNLISRQVLMKFSYHDGYKPFGG